MSNMNNNSSSSFSSSSSVYDSNPLNNKPNPFTSNSLNSPNLSLYNNQQQHQHHFILNSEMVKQQLNLKDIKLLQKLLRQFYLTHKTPSNWEFILSETISGSSSPIELEEQSIDEIGYFMCILKEIYFKLESLQKFYFKYLNKNETLDHYSNDYYRKNYSKKLIKEISGASVWFFQLDILVNPYFNLNFNHWPLKQTADENNYFFILQEILNFLLNKLNLNDTYLQEIYEDSDSDSDNNN